MVLRVEFRSKAETLQGAHFQEITRRLIALLRWMESQPEIKSILDQLRNDGNVVKIVEESFSAQPPQAGTPEEIAGVGLFIIDKCAENQTDLFQIAGGMGIDDAQGGFVPARITTEAMKRYVHPFLNYVLSLLPDDPPVANAGSSAQPFGPVAIQESLAAFRSDYPNPDRVAFIMMQFAETSAHIGIEKSIKDTLTKYSYQGVLARDKEYHDELYPNIQTYMHGCGFGIAVFDRVERDTFNPNVSLEVGYMLGLKKKLLLLKDKNLTALHADLVGKLYRTFDVLHPAETIPKEVESWMEDKSLI